jgi:hypothetical protein
MKLELVGLVTVNTIEKKISDYNWLVWSVIKKDYSSPVRHSIDYFNDPEEILLCQKGYQFSG